MGVMRFVVLPADALRDWPEVHRAYLGGADQSVWPTRVELDGNLMICRRQNSDSGRLYVAWPVPEFGRPVLCSASLPEREQPYLLVVELARGKIVQIRNQLAAWQGAGMAIPRDFTEFHHQAHQLFAAAAAAQDSPEHASLLAQDALVQACKAAESLTVSYTRQRLESRHRQYPNLPTALGCGLGHASPPQGDAERSFAQAFNAAAIPLEWRTIEAHEGDYQWEACDAQVAWCLKHELLLRCGPLLDLSPDGLPAWLKTWENDYWNLESFVCDFVETAITRYVGKVRIWEISARPNTGGALSLTEEQRLTLTAKTLDVARRADPEGQFLVRIDQPWGEYQAKGQHKLSPLHFIDALHRSGVGLSGVNLEVAVGYGAGGGSRDLIEVSRMIDQWSALGLPLQVTLVFPSQAGPDLHAADSIALDRSSWKMPWSEPAQAEWGELYLRLMMAKPAVVALFWSHFSDHVAHRFAHGGLLRPDGTPKPALQRIIKIRKAYWK